MNDGDIRDRIPWSMRVVLLLAAVQAIFAVVDRAVPRFWLASGLEIVALTPVTVWLLHPARWDE